MKLKIVFLMIAVFFLLCACSQSESGVPEWKELELPVNDFSEMSFCFGTAWIDEYAPTIGFSSAGDKMLKRYADVGTFFNTDFKVVATDDSTTAVVVAAASGLPSFDILDVHGSTALSLYKGGYLYPLEEIKTIDLSDENKWSPLRFRIYGIYDGLSYGFYPWSWEFIPQFEGVLLFNNELVKKAGLENPYSIQERGEWNWQTFKNYLISCENSLGEDGIVPMVRNEPAKMAQTAMMSNGVKTIVEKNGKFMLGYDCEEGYKALEYLAELEGESLMISGNHVRFASEATAVFMSCESHLGTLHSAQFSDLPATMLNDYGMMPFPYGPDADPTTVSAYVFHTRRLIWTIATSFNDMDDVGVILDFLFEPLDGAAEGVTPWKQFAEDLIFHHYEGYENFAYMVDNINYDYSAQLRDISSNLSLALTSVVLGNSTPSSAFASIRTLVQEAIDENITWIYKE